MASFTTVPGVWHKLLPSACYSWDCGGWGHTALLRVMNCFSTTSTMECNIKVKYYGNAVSIEPWRVDSFPTLLGQSVCSIPFEVVGNHG